MTDIERMAKTGKIRGFSSLPVNKKTLPQQTPLTETGSKIRLKQALEAFCREYGLPLFQEQRFHATRMWRLDFLIPMAVPLGIEYDGIYSSVNGENGHRSHKGTAKDKLKDREALKAGIRVVRYTAGDVDSVIQDLKHLIFFTNRKF